MVPKKLIVAVEGTAAIGAFWQTIFSDYLDKIIRCFCGNEATGQKPSTTHVELSVVMFSTHGSYSSCLVQRSGWTRDMDTFFQWLSAIPFAGGGFNDAAIAEGLAEALMMFSSPSGNQNQNVEGERHCILVAASNPYPLPTPVYRPKFQNPEKTDRIETQPDNCLSDAETLAKSFAQCAISLSIICPKQLPKLRGIYNAGKRDPRAGDPPVVNVKNPHFLVLISENFMEARSSLCGPGLTSLPSNQNPVKMDVTPVAPVSGPPPASAPSANGSVLVRPPISVGNILPATVKLEPPTLPSVTGPAFPNISSVPRPVSQAVPSFQTSSPMSTSQDTIPNNENAPDTKPSATYLTPSMRPAGMAAANVRILNDVAQARQALVGGTSIGLPSKTPVLSYMISSGMTTPSISTAQTVASVTGQNAQSPTSLAMSQPVSNNQGSVELGQSQTHPGMSQGNFSAARMVQTGMSVNQSMMSMSQQGQPGMVPAGVNSNNSVSNMTLNQHTSSTVQSAQSKYVRVWEGNLSGQRQGQPVFIARLEGYRNASASETLAARWPPTMQIVRLISQDHMNNRHYAGKADFLVFRALNQHGFLGQLQEKKLCAVIQLPSQTLMLSVSDKAHRLIGMLFPGDMVVFKPQIPNQQLQLQQQNLQQQQQQQQPMQMQHIVGMNQQEAAAAYIQGGGPGPGRSQIGQVSSQGPTTTMSGGGSFMS